jgi:hypothetical protein
MPAIAPFAVLSEHSILNPAVAMAPDTQLPLPRATGDHRRPDRVLRDFRTANQIRIELRPQ